MKSKHTNTHTPRLIRRESIFNLTQLRHNCSAFLDFVRENLRTCLNLNIIIIILRRRETVTFQLSLSGAFVSLWIFQMQTDNGKHSSDN